MAQLPSLKDVTSIIAIHSAKGGVGKSTVTINLAVALARKGAKVGLLDADVHGPSAALMLGTGEWPSPGPGENLIMPIKAHGIKFMSIANMTTRETPLIWRGPMVSSVINQLLGNVVWGNLDYLFIDMPPGTGDAQLTLAQNVPLSGVITVSTPQELAIEDTMRGIHAFSRVKVPVLGMVENMSWFTCDGCNHKQYPFGEDTVRVMAEEAGMPMLGSLPLEHGVCAGGDKGKPIVVSQPDSPAARAVDNLITNMVHQLEGRCASVADLDITWREMGWNERKAEPPKVEGEIDSAVAAVWQVSYDELGILWADGKHHVFSARALRLACPCAACVDEMSGEPLLDPETVPADLTIKEIKSVGRYAILPTFTDDHKHGIFHFDRLREMAEDF